ncbi:hypothetical protein SLEP1_g16112 [Rubroshorea leprosula]|uniref:Uncharacterized protein n=1 Tax=Rubroshorea leprosula TaxID=152421 RepID=A0AAV5IZ09_9ROSI|nr:hypothetical protein SLEP1_g16112 [Rubroshorea leprosula]
MLSLCCREQWENFVKSRELASVLAKLWKSEYCSRRDHCSWVLFIGTVHTPRVDN